ncbi:MAG: T9SS type A sorting domain-containing protein [Lacibacter sp.]
MIYLYPVEKLRLSALMLFAFLLLSLPTFSQLVLKNPALVIGDGKAVGSVYKFTQVYPGIDAMVSIDSLVGGATLDEIDLKGVGYEDAFQPKIKSGGKGISYILFTIRFVIQNTSIPVTMSSVTATNLDLDGNNSLKERCEFDMKGGKAVFASTTPEISVTVNNGHFLGQNISGKEYTDIDTSAQAVMFKATGTNINEFTVRLGASLSNTSSSSRQYSVYIKDFILTNSATLPVTLIGFQAVLKGNSSLLNWTTTTHTNFSHFVVEKSTNGKDFAEAGILFADSSYSSILSNYSFKENLQNVSAKAIFYRLKMVDIDNKYSYSEIRMLRLSNEPSIKISTFPNPVTNELRVQIPAEWQEKQVLYEIYNSNGILVKHVSNAKASQVQQINVSNLGAGTFIVKVRTGSETMSSKIIKAN